MSGGSGVLAGTLCLVLLLLLHHAHFLGGARGPRHRAPRWDSAFTGEHVDFSTAQPMTGKLIGLPGPELVHRKGCSCVEGELGPATEGRAQPGLASGKHLSG